MPREIDIHFFRDNLVPMWEDSPEGGIVILKIKKDDNIDKMWESILFSMIGKSHSLVQLKNCLFWSPLFFVCRWAVWRAQSHWCFSVSQDQRAPSPSVAEGWPQRRCANQCVEQDSSLFGSGPHKRDSLLQGAHQIDQGKCKDLFEMFCS